ncbi:transforming growth factor-beta-induced protein ig-h3-like [Mercenaria mercenaria]|uniref:transforming growth factor-beta-induced protein ig-h3-like n=1 Tax=Mercenaria mercenaria TaxID=6596 RepID=UPI00234F09DF|nr:transforming growth factor-beta-induced protein ig-h3-like [Mercenaria mercenaria]
MKIACFVVCLVAVTSAENIVELATKLGANTLVKLVTDAGLGNTLATGGPFTVFGPTDAAFAKLPKAVLERLMRDKTLLADVLKYHVVSGSVYSSQLTNELTAPSLLTDNGKAVDIRFNIYKNGQLITADGSPVVMPNQNASNGVIHVVDRVLFPIPLKNIPELVTMERGRFSTLLTAVEKANLATTLAGGPFTLFAPTNAAFAKVPADVLNKLLANVTALTDVLTYHVVSGTVWSASLTNGEMAKTVEGKTVTIDISGGGVKINDAKVEEADLAVTNGVIHVIDSVLLPPAFDIFGIY